MDGRGGICRDCGDSLFSDLKGQVRKLRLRGKKNPVSTRMSQAYLTMKPASPPLFQRLCMCHGSNTNGCYLKRSARCRGKCQVVLPSLALVNAASSLETYTSSSQQTWKWLGLIHTHPLPQKPKLLQHSRGIFRAQGVLRTSCGWSSFSGLHLPEGEDISCCLFLHSPTFHRLSVQVVSESEGDTRKRPLSLERGSLGPLNRK